MQKQQPSFKMKLLIVLIALAMGIYYGVKSWQQDSKKSELSSPDSSLTN